MKRRVKTPTLTNQGWGTLGKIQVKNRNEKQSQNPHPYKPRVGHPSEKSKSKTGMKNKGKTPALTNQGWGTARKKSRKKRN
jgi:hypothetical protein